MGNAQIFYCPKSILRKLYLNLRFILIFYAKNSPNDFIYFQEQYQTIFKDFYRLEDSEEALGSWSLESYNGLKCD